MKSAVLSVLIMALSLSVLAQQTDADAKNPMPLQAILNGPDRTDMPWKVQFSEPRLMYQQQYFLEIRTRVPAEILSAHGKQHILHFMTKVGDGSGHWLEGDQYNRFEPTSELGSTKVVQCDMAVYLRPGDYTVAMIAFDSTSNQSNVVRKKIVIPLISGDPIPELNSHIPVVEFPSDFPQLEVSRTDKSDGEFFPTGQLSPLQVPTGNRIRIDVVLNVSRATVPEPRPRHIPDRGYPYPIPPTGARSSSSSENTPKPSELALGRVLQITSVLSRVSPQNGCVFVTAIDPLHMKVAVPTKPAGEIDWADAQKELSKSDQSMIDVRILQNHKGPGLFLRDTLQELASPTSTCGTGQAPDAHYILVVSPTLNFPEFGKEMRLSNVTAERARFYYFHVRNDSPFPDDVGKVLKSANPKRLEINDPEGFRRAFASFISDLRSRGN